MNTAKTKRLLHLRELARLVERAKLAVARSEEAIAADALLAAERTRDGVETELRDSGEVEAVRLASTAMLLDVARATVSIDRAKLTEKATSAQRARDAAHLAERDVRVMEILHEKAKRAKLAAEQIQEQKTADELAGRRRP